ncbi:histidine phosphatase family protein [Pseudoroseicyclus tamaricis]|uniref:Histidine phosphatase family protein n=1 Tax=Pseudoroseicyclus tamaricis TaxID=2705421 RepID=A0A6B2JWS7_9RHOB|nr:histidine phosphatase family protein [Pseudoroseicyclus tamaricis]NDV01119.1 histidine phosphatase family protein [Pseudoroseicyclus tamaricis]
MRLIYVSHPEVVIDPGVPVPDWQLSEVGRARTQALAARGWPGDGWRFVSSPERKARETAGLLAAGGPVEVAETSGEIDRSATGYLPHAEHEAHADALFGEPERSAGGWERAVDAQGRMLALAERLAGEGRDTLLVGHGGVGTLLWCALAGRPIARAEDQRGGGHVWEAAWEGGAWAARHPWRPFEALGEHA